MAKRAYRTLLFLAAVALPGTAGHSEEGVDKIDVDTSFDATFESFEVLPPAPQPGAQAVDLTNIEPATTAAIMPIEGGVASYYGRRFNGRRTASGEIFDMHAMTAAHRTLPFGTLVQVTNPDNGRSVVVRINDRGPFHGNRVIDVSRAAATELGLIGPGHGQVELALVEG
ncbi:septal ring lytic transglycosylase RlpA family protein [Erythrobacter mangrovi]|uniref:Endolytic peptidoglycan transglycosylase RlpA n=1 Tax=Erythrobacter mangrovi TaxID=2739433 RepID=A0A7D3XJ92_9SPHN|nr:septal ring lytic transglycosylase RlpA family protein [Erythrobacter mangrovi]QKG71879.1 septal ring lytic transglycosylase RlpA family protein [Erythrobacter mangrovi]